MSYSRLALFLFVLPIVTCTSASAQPEVINNLDGGPGPVGSLRWAVTTASPGDSITFNLADHEPGTVD